MEENPTLEVEKRSIDFVPHNERFGKAGKLFLLWFTVNASVLTIATGAIAVALGLPLGWAIFAAIFGHSIGAIFMALHSAQGPILGIPQMIQSRAQFGYIGAVLPLVLVVVMYIGYFAGMGVLAGNALASLLNINVDLGIIIMNALGAVIAIFGYRLLQAWVNVVSWFTAAAFLVLTVGFIVRNDFSQAVPGEFSWGIFFLAVTISATWQLTYAPYVADYSRYLPADTSVKATFWWTYSGTVVSAVWMFSLGAALAAFAPEAFGGGSVEFIVQQGGFAPWLFLAIVILSSVPILGVDLYGAFMSSTTILGSFNNARTVSQFGRVVSISIISVLGTLIAVLGRGDFLDNLSNFIVLLAIFLIPWTSINLVDFYLVRKEKYDIDDIFNPKGRYQGSDWRAMTAYFVGIAVEIPFMSTAFYTGPFVDMLGGADISWVFGLFVSAGLFYFLMTKYPIRRGFAPTPGDGIGDPSSVSR